MNLIQGDQQRIEIPKIQIGLRWDVISSTTDLDASCIFYNEFGKIVDAVFYNQLVCFAGGVVHSGDNKTGEGMGDDEIITIDFSAVPENIQVMMITVSCYRSGNFGDVETAAASVRDMNGNVICEMFIGSFGQYTSLIMCSLQKQSDGFWYLKNVAMPSSGRTFQHMGPTIRNILRDYIGDEKLTAGMYIEGKSFEMEKGDIFDIPDIDDIIVGLGWDFLGEPVDLDASVILYNNNAESEEIICFSNLNSRVAQIKHSGDNRTGEGDGDDETISIKLSSVPFKVSTIVVVVNIYSGSSNFSTVRNPYVRLMTTNGEICKYNLGESCGNDNGLIMAKIYRTEFLSREWGLIALGEPAYGTLAKDLVRPIVEKGIVENYSALEMEYISTKKQQVPESWKIVIMSGEDLVAKDKNGFSDPYIKYSCSGLKGKTGKVKKTLNPTWNYEIHLDLPHASYSEDIISFLMQDPFANMDTYIFEFEVWDHDKIGKHGF